MLASRRQYGGVSRRLASAGMPSARQGCSSPLVGLSLLWQVGAHADAWYHAHYGTTIDSFFAWTRALLYAAWAGTAVLVLVRLARPNLWAYSATRTSW
jgi:hypothetical protein